MAANRTAPDYFLRFIEHQGTEMALVPLGETNVPRLGEWVTLPSEGGTTEVVYEVTRVVYHYGRRWNANDPPSLLSVTVTLKERAALASSRVK